MITLFKPLGVAKRPQDAGCGIRLWLQVSCFGVMLGLIGRCGSCLGEGSEPGVKDDPTTKLMTNLVAQPQTKLNPDTNAIEHETATHVLPAVDELLRPPENKQAKAPGYERQLLLARQFRLDKNVTEAGRLLTGLVQQELPEEFRKQVILELAYVAQADNQPLKAIQLLAHYLEKYPNDSIVPELLLRQGLIYRQMGANNLAINKLYAVLTKSISVKSDHLEYYQQIVLQAQTEIAETYYAQGQLGEAAVYFSRLLKNENPALNQAVIHFKLVRCMAGSGQLAEMVPLAESFLALHRDAPEVPEVRFLLVRALKELGRNQEALSQVFALLESQKLGARKKPGDWAYWQQRTGNEIANQLYKEGDFYNALQVYNQLAQLNTAPEWQLPAWYQVGLVYERLQQPQKATDAYNRILGRQKELETNALNPSLLTVCDMAKWRKDFLAWNQQAEKNTREFTPAVTPVPSAAGAH
jgi:tetratricopeptide (TPR) repeat protein